MKYIIYNLFEVKKRIHLELEGEFLTFKFTQDDIDNDRPITLQHGCVSATMQPDGKVIRSSICFGYCK